MEDDQSEFTYGERWDVFSALPASPDSILDIGCGTGLGFQTYRERGSRLVGVDIDPEVLEEASKNMDEARLLNIETEEWPAEFHKSFDVVAFCDTLEHLNDPWKVLQEVRPLLTEKGTVVASIPNIRQIRLVIKLLLLGRWDYAKGAGTIQVGHLRFFTRKTISDMFVDAGYARPKFLFPTRTFHLNGPERLLNRLTRGLFSDLLYGSYLVQAKPETSGAFEPGG